MIKLEQFRVAMEKAGLDGCLLTNTYNIRYMSNFTGSSGVVLISHTEAKLITDFRYMEQAAKQAVGYEIVKHKGSVVAAVAEQAKAMGIKKLGFEQDQVTYSYYKALESVFLGELTPVSGLTEKLRLIKTPAEIKILKDAAEIADAAFAHIVTFIRPGLTELEISNELEFFMRRQGATSSSFDTIVASGKRSALPHGVATSKVIESGDFVTLDFGAYYNGYVSDITRTLAVGQPSDELKKIYQIVLEAQLAGMSGIKPGMTGKEADALTRDIIEGHGYGPYFGHSTGHGIGLEVHEEPGLSAKSDVILMPGMAVTVEPGIYLPEIGGVRIEDDTLITKEGNEALTHSPKELLIL